MLSASSHQMIQPLLKDSTMSVFKKTPLVKYLTLSTATLGLLLNQSHAGIIEKTATIDVAIGESFLYSGFDNPFRYSNYNATISSANKVSINDGDILQKTGAGNLFIVANQGQSTNDPSKQDGISGIVALKEGVLCIGHNNALGNGFKYNNSNGTAIASKNYLCMSTNTTLSTISDISSLSVPIHIVSGATVVIDASFHNLTLAAIMKDSGSSAQTIIFKNSGNYYDSAIQSKFWAGKIITHTNQRQFTTVKTEAGITMNYALAAAKSALASARAANISTTAVEAAITAIVDALNVMTQSVDYESFHNACATSLLNTAKALVMSTTPNNTLTTTLTSLTTTVNNYAAAAVTARINSRNTPNNDQTGWLCQQYSEDAYAAGINALNTAITGLDTIVSTYATVMANKITLNGLYTQGSADDVMVLSQNVNLQTSAKNQMAPSLQMNNGSQLTLGASITFPKITVHA